MLKHQTFACVARRLANCVFYVWQTKKKRTEKKIEAFFATCNCVTPIQFVWILAWVLFVSFCVLFGAIVFFSLLSLWKEEEEKKRVKSQMCGRLQFNIFLSFLFLFVAFDKRPLLYCTRFLSSELKAQTTQHNKQKESKLQTH